MEERGRILLYFQLLFIFLFFVTGPWFPANPFLFFVELTGIALGGWAVFEMSAKSKFNAYPQPAKGAKLLNSGPYKYIRNPMYSAIILIMASVLLDSPTLMRTAFLCAEIYVLISKIKIEEVTLNKTFKRYSAYKSHTKKLIPFIY